MQDLAGMIVWTFVFLLVPSAPQIVELLNTNGDKVAVIVRWFPPLDLNGPPPSYKVSACL